MLTMPQNLAPGRQPSTPRLWNTEAMAAKPRSVTEISARDSSVSVGFI